MDSFRFFEFVEERTQIEFTQRQKEIITSDHAVIQVLATAGSGKTTTVVSKIGYWIAVNHLNTNKILALTYSRASAKDLKERHFELFGDRIHQVNYSTLHAFAFSVLRRVYKRKNKRLVLIDSDESKMNRYSVMSEAYKKINKSFATKEVLDDLFSEISYVKNALISVQCYSARTTGFLKLYDEYELAKKNHDVIDFDDMLSICLILFDEHPEILAVLHSQYEYIVLDEGQDINSVQIKLMKKLTQKATQLVVIGDDDQSIYGFRAADPEYLITLVKGRDDAVSYELTTNYRCPSNLIKEASILIKHNKIRLEKGIYAKDDRVGIIDRVPCIKSGAQYGYVLDELATLNEVDLKQTCILFRNNYSMVPLVYLLTKENLPIYIKEPVTSFMNHWVVKDLFMILELIEDRYNLPLLIKVLPKLRIFVKKENKDRISKANITGNAFDFLKNQLSGKAKIAVSDIVYEMNGCKGLTISSKIDRIVNLMGYGEYMNDRADRGNYGRSIPQTIIHGLKLILEDALTNEDAKNRLVTLTGIMEQLKYSKKGTGVSLLTMHGSKGLEFDNVILVDLADDLIPMKNTHTEDELLEEERRLFYVAITRAKSRLKMIYPIQNPSRFILEMQGKEPKSDKPMMIHANKGKVHVDFKQTGMFINNYNDLEEGLAIVHQVFGRGIIQKIEKDDVSLKFGSEVKVFSLELLVDARLLKK